VILKITVRQYLLNNLFTSLANFASMYMNWQKRKKNTCRETKKLANLPQDVLYAKDIPSDVEDKVAKGILKGLDKLKKTMAT